MKKRNNIITYSATVIFLLAIILANKGCSPKFSLEDKANFTLLRHENGPVIGYSSASGIEIMKIKRLAFKDLNRNGKLDPYEDWRLPAEERAKDLAAQMT
ncbi:MAG TPA: hypothetical protein PLW67_12175, partial [Prolixibacteraceae bacterium]|nr:hypothetical protein [Prolixibacteraceae bacterium]